MKKVSSIVWQFFDRLEENKRCVAVLCKLCDTEYKYFGNTTNLRAHLIKKHPIQWEFRQNSVEGTKILNVSSVRNIYEDEECTNQSTISPRRSNMTKAAKEDKNVRYSVSIQNPNNETTGEETLPRIEIQRVDVLTNAEEENDDDEATTHLIHQMHNQGSEEEWLEEDYVEFEPKRKRVSYGKIKREVISPPRRHSSTFISRSTPKPEKREVIYTDDSRKDEYSVFGEYIANKLRKFKAPRTRGNIQQLITTILWQAEYGMFDDADSVKRVLMCTVQNPEKVQASIVATEDQAEDMHEEEQEDEHNQSTDSVELDVAALGLLPAVLSFFK